MRYKLLVGLLCNNKPFVKLLEYEEEEDAETAAFILKDREWEGTSSIVLFVEELWVEEE